MGISIFDLFLFAIGVYVLVSGIRGKGRLFTTQNVKEGCEEKIMKGQKIYYIIVGIGMMLNGLSSLLISFLYDRTAGETAYIYTPKVELGSFSFLTPEFLSMMMFIFMLVSLVAIVGLIIFLRKMTNRVKRGGASSATTADGKPAVQHILPTSAFEFDEEEKKDKPEKN